MLQQNRDVSINDLSCCTNKTEMFHCMVVHVSTNDFYMAIFFGKKKERCEVYVGWLAAIGVLAHFGTEFGRGPNSSENFDRYIILFGT